MKLFKLILKTEDRRTQDPDGSGYCRNLIRS